MPESRKSDFKIGTLHGKINATNSNSEYQIQRKFYIKGNNLLLTSKELNVEIRLLGYEIPLFTDTKRGKSIDLLGYDNKFVPYIIELKTAKTRETISDILNQVNDYASLLTNCLPYMEDEIKKKFFWDNFSFSSKDAGKIILIQEEYYENKRKELQENSFTKTGVYICSFKEKDTKNNDNPSNDKGIMNVKIENK